MEDELRRKYILWMVETLKGMSVQNKGQIEHGTIHTEVGAWNAALTQILQLLAKEEKV